ncbi:MAG: prepilin-type N-terminal cleavage/methylation domain-containing protein [Magnetococcales bacterium]|nr:prepilin-type N-terminal cleavage/methylation domain-containing protein [Magnetococcales bacterium]
MGELLAKMRHRRVRLDCRGFTLLEMIIVVVIIGVLASMALPQFGNMTPAAANASATAVASSLGAAAASRNARCRTGIEANCATTSLTCDQALALVSGITASDYTISSAGTACTVRHIQGDITYTSASITNQ